MKTREYNPARRERAVLHLHDVLGVDEGAASFTIAGISPGRLRKMEELGQLIEAAEKARADSDDPDDQVAEANEGARAMCDQVEVMCIGGAGLADRLYEVWEADDDRLTMTELMGIQSFILEEVGLETSAAPNS